MKTKPISILILILILLSTGSYAQNDWQIIDTSFKWSIIIHDAGESDMTHIVKFSDQDTIIDNLAYRKVMETFNPDETDWSFMDLFIREDIENKQVYLRNLIGEEGLIYDFSIVLGDTVTIHNVIAGGFIKLEVVSVDSVYIYDSYRKRFEFEPVNWPYWDSWVEGIGSMSHGVIYSGFYNTSPWYTLLCYKQNDVVKYMNPYYTACFYPYVSIEESEVSDLQLYFNHEAKSIEVVNLPPNQFFDFTLFDLFGRKIVDAEISGKAHINLNNYRLADGLYIYSIKNKGHRYSGKIAITN